MGRGKGSGIRLYASTALAGAVILASSMPVQASDHFDSPAMTANPQADIGDVYAWTAPDGAHLNLVMTIAGHTFSDRLTYAFHVDSGRTFGHTTASTSIVCRFPAPRIANCRVGDVDRLEGDAGAPHGLVGRNGRFRVFAGLRDDPFYNNIKGTLAAYGVATAAIKAGAPVDAGGCPHLDSTATIGVADQWGHTDGGPPTNILTNWTASAIAVSVDLAVVNKGGNLLAVWGSSATSKRQLDRMGRPFVGNTLLGASPFSTDDASGNQRQAFNVGLPWTKTSYVPTIQRSLAFQDGLDGVCGNQLTGRSMPSSPARYRQLAQTFADDRLWVNAASKVCTQFFAVELARLAGRSKYASDCGGRSPTYGTPNVWRSLLISGDAGGRDWDGLHGDEHPPSATEFPFLAAPDPHGVDH